MAELTATVSAEAVMNKALHKLATDFFNEYNIKIEAVKFDYIITQAVGESPFATRVSVDMVTTYIPGGEV